MKSFAFRLKPHEDLKKSILKFSKKHKIKGGVILTCVGSLEQFSLRFAHQEKSTTKKGYFEIVSLTGTFSESASHLHLAISDSTGKTIGGHLLENNFIYTTAELVVVDLTDLTFEREMDSTYGFNELSIKKRKSPSKK